MIEYLVSKLYSLFVYPANQAGGIGYVEIDVDKITKVIVIESRAYGCWHNAPYIENHKLGDMYLNVLRSKGWKVELYYVD